MPEIEDVKGSMYMRWTCPHCENECELEGDRSGEEVECDYCSTKVHVTEVM